MSEILQRALSKASPGAIDHGQGIATFGIYAPGKKSVHVQGDFNGWDFRKDPLADNGQGYWLCQKQLATGTYRYQFMLDESLVIPDPYSWAVDRSDPSRRAVSILQMGRPIYQWKHDGWQRPAFRDLIIYEMHVGDFTPEGTFRGVLGKLDYLHDLGINAIEFMPLYESDPDDYWGYRPEFHLAVASRYGSMEDLLLLVDECHARGIAVILDMVLAHTSQNSPLMMMYPYEKSPWFGRGLGKENQFGLPMLDYTKPPTNSFIRDVQKHWLGVYHFDGFRYDYLIGIGEDKKRSQGVPYLMRTAREIRPEAYCIGEVIPEAPDVVNDSGLSGVWHTRSRLVLTVLTTEQKLYSFDWNKFEELIRNLDPSTQGYRSGEFMVNYVESHDDDRVVTLALKSGFDQPTALAKAALAGTVLMTSSGPAMMYMGQEFGAEGTKTLTVNKLNWGLLDQPPRRKLLEHFRNMINLRRSHASIRGGPFCFRNIDAGRHTVAYNFCMGETDVIVVGANFSRNAGRMTFKAPQAGEWHEYLSDEIQHIEENLSIDLPPYSARVFIGGPS